LPPVFLGRFPSLKRISALRAGLLLQCLLGWLSLLILLQFLCARLSHPFHVSSPFVSVPLYSESKPIIFLLLARLGKFSCTAPPLGRFLPVRASPCFAPLFFLPYFLWLQLSTSPRSPILILALPRFCTFFSYRLLNFSHAPAKYFCLMPSPLF